MKEDFAQFVEEMSGIKLNSIQKQVVNNWKPNSFVVFPRQSGRKFYFDTLRDVLRILYDTKKGVD